MYKRFDDHIVSHRCSLDLSIYPPTRQRATANTVRLELGFDARFLREHLSIGEHSQRLLRCVEKPRQRQPPSCASMRKADSKALSSSALEGSCSTLICRSSVDVYKRFGRHTTPLFSRCRSISADSTASNCNTARLELGLDTSFLPH